MPRAPVIPQWAIDERAEDHRRERKIKEDFVRRFPAYYPAPHIESEWQAFICLLRFWSERQIKRFVRAYGKDGMRYPGVLDTGDYPSLREFMRDVGTLAKGEYARTLPEEEMVALLAGKDAVRGVQTSRGSSRGGSAPKAEITARNKRMALEFQRRREKDTHMSDTAIKVAVGRALVEKKLGRSASIAAINAGLDNLKKSSG